MIVKRHIFLSALLAIGVMLTGCSSRDMREAQEVVKQADSLRAEGVAYTDSVTMAGAYNTLEEWQYIYPTDYARACYYYGRLLRNNDDPVAAMQVFINATHSRSKDYHILGRIYSNMGSISHLAGEFQLAYDMYSRSADLFLQSGDTLLYYYLLNDMAVELAEQRDTIATIVLLDSILHCNFADVIRKTKETRAIMYLRSQQYEKVILELDTLEMCGYNDILKYLMKAQAYECLGKQDSALYYANLLTSSTTDAAYLISAYYTISHEDTTLTSDSILSITSARSDAQKEWGMQHGRYSQAIQLLEQDLKRRWEWRGWFALVVIILSSVIIIVISHKRRMHQKMMQNITDNHSKRTLESIKTHIDTSNLEQTLHWKKYALMKIEADLYMSGIVSNLEAQHLNETEIRYCVLTLLDFKPKYIADILCYSYPSGIKTLKKRIANKLGTEPQELKDFLLHLPYKV